MSGFLFNGLGESKTTKHEPSRILAADILNIKPSLEAGPAHA
jgi:hypothetical protein